MTSAKMTLALTDMTRRVRDHYGKRLLGVYQLSTAGEYDDEDAPEAEIVVVLKDGDWRLMDEIEVLAGLAFDSLMVTEIYISADPISSSAWDDPSHEAHRETVGSRKTAANALLEVV